MIDNLHSLAPLRTRLVCFRVYVSVTFTLFSYGRYFTSTLSPVISVESAQWPGLLQRLVVGLAGVRTGAAAAAAAATTSIGRTCFRYFTDIIYESVVYIKRSTVEIAVTSIWLATTCVAQQTVVIGTPCKIAYTHKYVYVDRYNDQR